MEWNSLKDAFADYMVFKEWLSKYPREKAVFLAKLAGFSDIKIVLYENTIKMNTNRSYISWKNVK